MPVRNLTSVMTEMCLTSVYYICTSRTQNTGLITLSVMKSFITIYYYYASLLSHNTLQTVVKCALMYYSEKNQL